MLQWPALQIGSLRVALPVVLAPLAGYSDLPYRRTCRQLGCAYCTTEMTLDQCVITDRKQQRKILATDAADHPTAGQLIGNDPGTMATAAKIIEARGFDVVDLNFACPVNKAMKRRRGGYMMQQPREVVEIVRAVVGAVGVPVTLKVRQAYDAGGSEDAFWQLAAGAREAGAAAIIVHGRSVEAKYAGPADWDFLARVKRAFADWTVVGSGDVLTPASALAMREQTGVDGVCVARGVLGNPWFFRQAADLLAGREMHQPDLAEQRAVMEQHLAWAVEVYGERKAPKLLRKFGIKYARMHPSPKTVRMAFVAVRRPADWQGVLAKYYA